MVDKTILLAIGYIACVLVISSSQTSAAWIVAWGDNSYGQVNDVPTTNDFVAVSAGGRHNLALRSDGSIVAWGCNQWEQCNVPVGNDFVAVAAGANHSVALRSDGTIVAWGGNSDDGQNISPQGGTYVSIAAGANHNLAVMYGGALEAWGYNYWGQCGPGSSDFAVRSPISVGPSNVRDYAGGQFHTVAVLSDGTLACWGGRAGHTGPDQWQLHDLPEGSDFVDVAAGDYFSAALREDGTVATWGNQASLMEGSDFDEIDAGGSHLLGIRSDSTLVAIGDNTYGQCNVPNGDGFITVDGGWKHSVALYIPEPVTFSLLAVGGFALIRRHRM